MITYVAGDLFQSPAQVLVNTVNTVGVMGKGIAADFKRIYPDMVVEYRALCERKQFDIGQLWLWKTPHKWILNFPTKKHWRHPSNPEFIRLGLEKFVATYADKGIVSISFPQLGCGNGELDWETQVRPLMEQYLSLLPITIFIHLYQKADVVPEHYDVDAIEAWLHGEPQALAFREFWADLEKLLRSKRQFKTLDTGNPFEVVLQTDLEGIEIRPKGQSPFVIAKDDNGLLDLWQYVRAAGYCMPDKLPAGLDVYASYLVGLLSELDYMRPVSLSRTDNQQQIGLQLIPKLDDRSDVSELTSNVITLT
jgi:O-acetyl-ADP-ribose deacetylase (regulator of RNase III)